MNIFEDLIEELKEENLLEETVIEVQKNKNNNRALYLQNKQPAAPGVSNTESYRHDSTDSATAGPINSQIDTISSNESGQQAGTENFANPANLGGEAGEPAFSDSNAYDTAQRRTGVGENSFDEEKKLNQAEFYKKRATDEVTSLQMVEHVLSGAERDFLHVTPKLYDDLEVKKALHTFLQFSQNINSPEHAQAEFLLMQETEGWYSALSQKDKNINVDNLRRYCETTRPALSSQALAALARFYRNAPFSESVRSKFDLVMTRFFARETGGDIRKILLTREEMIEKLTEFYADWSSIPLYATEADESGIVIAAMKFEDFMNEAEAAENFEELVNTGFFERLNEFKQGTHENFFAPLVTAAAIESNVRIGNRCVELILKEQQKPDVENFAERYDSLFEQTISANVCKTLEIANVLEGRFADSEIVRETPAETPEPARHIEYEKQDLKKQPVKNTHSQLKTKNPLFKVNKWLLAATVTVLICSVGLYLYVEYFNPPPKLSANVKIVNLDNSSLKEFIQTARLNGDMFYGIVNPNWDGLNKEEKEELLRKVIMIGGEKGFVRVSLMDKQGRNVGYASPEKVEVYNP